MIAIAFSMVALACYVALALITICRGVKKKTNQAFMLYLAATAFGQFAALMVSFGNSAESALFWYKLMAAGSGMYFLFHLFFILTFLGVKRQHYLFYVGGLIYLCLLVLSGTSLVIRGVFRSDATGLYIPHFGPLTPMIVVTPCFLLFYGIYRLIQAYRKTIPDQQRNRIKYLLLGAGIVTIGASTNVSTTLRAYPIDIASNVVNACLIAYAILRYQLLGIKVIVRKSLHYFVPTVIIGVFYFSLIMIAVHVFHTFAGYQILIFSLLMAAIVAVVAQPLRNKAQFWIDRLFFREEYDSQSMLQRLSQTAASVLDLDQLTNMILDEITTTIHISRAAIFLRQEESQELRMAAQKGWSRNASLRLRKGHPIVDWLSSHPHALSMYDVEVMPHFQSLWNGGQENLEQTGAELFIPLKANGELVGILILGPKLSEEVYSQDDQLTLITLANQIALAVEKARLYEQAQQEIAERRKAEEQVRGLARFPSENPNPVLRVARDGAILYANEASLALLSAWGCKVSEPLPDQWRELVMEVSSSGSSREIEFADENCTLSLTFAPIANADYVNIYGLDITDRKRMEEGFLKIEKLESIGTLAGGIAHDFNNILTAIVGNISLAEMYVESGSETGKVLERLKEAERASMLARDLTQQLLTFSKGGAPIKKMASMSELLKESVALVLRGSNVGCEFSIPDDLWPVEIDEGQINQVINNLIINADQAMASGGAVKVVAENTIIAAESGLPLEPGAYTKVSVEDEGTGISEDHIQKIFDPYFTTKQKGSGLGLSTSYSIIKNHDGHIIVESQVGVGTAFHIYLPASPEETLVVEEKIVKQAIMGTGRILVMDDEKHVRDTAASMLSSLGYKVTTAIDGFEAIEIYKEALESGNLFYAVIIDLTIPGGMGGKEAIEKLIEIDPEVKAIVSSGYSSDSVMADFGRYGFKGVIGKPYKTIEMSEVLHKVIAG